MREIFVEADKQLIKYAERQEPDYKQPVDDELEKLNSLRSRVTAYALDRSADSQVNAAIDAYIGTYETIEKHMVLIFQSDEIRLGIEDKMFGQMKELNVETLKQQKELSAEIEAQNSASLIVMLLVSGIGVLFSVAIAAFIVLKLVSTLRSMAGYADEVGNGQFGGKLTVNEPGELGMVAASLRNIPDVLNKVVDEYRKLALKVSTGHMRERAAVEGFKGEYAGLVAQTNTLLDSMADVLDMMPAMVVAYDMDYTITYMNKSADNLLGNLIGQSCPEMFRTRLGEPTDPQKQSEAEFDDARGNRKHVSISSTPNTDIKGNVVGSITVLNDMTAINEAYSVMTAVAGEADVYAERVVAAAEELSAQVDQITSGTEMQRDQVHSTATAMEQMNATVLDVARNSGEASKQSDETRAKAQEGSELVNALVRNINRVNQIASNLHEDMQQLGSQAEAVGGVMDVISDIADQTNLLALNAAIEAARAGEAGRGFAVVADEVRKLAEKTMTATSEVGSSIQAIQDSAAQNIKNVDEAVASVTEANEMANNSGEALKDIVRMANDSSLLISGIATAAEEQSATSEEINRAVDGISQIAGETAHGMLESSSAVRELATVAQELKVLLDKLNSVAKA